MPLEDGTPYHHVIANAGFFDGGFSMSGLLREADARLIAAAPDLLAAVKALIDQIPYSCDSVKCECGVNGNGFDDEGAPCCHILAMRAIEKAENGEIKPHPFQFQLNEAGEMKLMETDVAASERTTRELAF